MDLCIIGAGAAGITIARALRGSGLKVCLLEGGGMTPSEASQSLYRGHMKVRYRGLADVKYLSQSRVRYFGGSTNHWTGWCRPLDAADFSVHDHIPRSGWPLRRADLSAHYRQACALCEIPPFAADLQRWQGTARPPLPLQERVQTALFHFSAPTRFGQVYRQDVLDDPDTALILNATAVAIEAEPSRRHVTAVQVRSLDGQRVVVRPRGVVLAAGGIENPRLLLLSALGNAHDQVGRCFMEHPHQLQAGWVAFGGQSEQALHLYRHPAADPVVAGRSRGVLVLSEAVRRAERLQGACVRLYSFGGWEGAALDEAVGALASTGGRQRARAVLMAVGEQRPNPDSRVTLSPTRRDALGLPRPELSWRLTDEDADSLRRTLAIVAAELGASRIGRGRIVVPSESPWKQMVGGYHHMGTTRMSESPQSGVVDARCRVHGIDNLWIAGSSVFPTVGYANPTLTIVALALRLAAHLREELAP